jgi:hypothetical protein
MESKNSQVAVADGGQATASSLEAPTTKKYLVPGFVSDPSGFYGGWVVATVGRDVFIRDVTRDIADKPLYILNAVVPREGLLFISRVDVDVATEILKQVNRIESYIGHEATAKLLSQLSGREIQFNRAQYTPKRGDVALVVRLKTRPAADVKDLKVEDLEFLVVWYLE